MLWVSVPAFAVAWWLGLHLLARDARKPVLRRAGGGLLGYAVALVVEQATAGADGSSGVRLVLLSLPAIAWSGALTGLGGDDRARRADRAWLLGVVPLFALASALVLAGVDAARPALLVLAAGSLGGALAVVLAGHGALRAARSRASTVRAVLVAAVLMLGLGTVLVVLGFDLLPRALLLPSIGVDLVLLGVVIVVFDAFDEGESVRADLLRSLLSACAATVVFGGQVVVAIAVTGLRLPLVLLLYGVVAAAIGIQVLAGPLQSVLDRFAFRSAPRLRAARGELREVSDALPRKDREVRLADLADAEFARLTRQALRHYGDLGKLVSSPLTELPAIGTRLAARGVPDGPLERAAELKALLLESVTRLKPATGEEFGTSEEWRHYNALYFYYVRGIRPYSVRTKRTDLDPVSRKALAWFADQVPERTLHNWQSAAARIVAADLRTALTGQTPRR
ncbi:hypothetical protein B0I33_107299 [Prauserella shujinwangii]|uniref:Uncharacterized protein n=1 Tax=Prauserella shujinwangii TaxID=1453103 RepID=A0A2T0LSS4_9PSEU|nr:hypothetical protein [Prauserella shujinwangii]PRX46721.1 hypothetical protein B0I33_107299 [Prauserella shujinwangii]